jgi:hypothetical protein
MNLCNQYCGEQKRKDYEKHCPRQAKSIGMGIFLSKRGKSDDDGRVYKKSRHRRKCRIPLEVARDRENYENRCEGYDRDMWSAKAWVNSREKCRKIPLLSHSESKARRMQHVCAEIPINRNQCACCNQRSPEGPQEMLSASATGLAAVAAVGSV